MGLGIDFGTSFTAAAYADRVQTRLIELEYDRTVSPTTVYVQPDGALSVGHEAELAGAARPDCVLVDIKHDIGRSQPYRVSGRDISPVDAVAAVLRSVRVTAEQRYGFRSDVPATITTPSVFGTEGARIDALRGAALKAGFNAEQIAFVPEPVAAATGYFSGEWHRPSFASGDALLVYDLGGGTFDAAALRTSPVPTVIGLPVGDDTIGGRKFDRIILDALLGRCGDEVRTLYERPHDGAAVSAWRARSVAARRMCSDVKERLAAMRETPVALPDMHGEAPVLRVEEMERLLTPLIETTAALMQRLAQEVTETGLRPAAVLLVGGSCRLPVVRSILEARLGLPLLAAPDPARIVAIGAAIEARRRSQGSGVEPSRSHGARDGSFARRDKD